MTLRAACEAHRGRATIPCPKCWRWRLIRHHKPVHQTHRFIIPACLWRSSAASACWRAVIERARPDRVRLASMTSIICFVSGVQLICLGVIGNIQWGIWNQASPAVYYQRYHAEFRRDQGGVCNERQVWKGSTLLNPEPPVLVSCGGSDKPDLITVGWTSDLHPAADVGSISVQPRRYSHHLIKKKRRVRGESATRHVPPLAGACQKRPAMWTSFAMPDRRPADKVGTVLVEKAPSIWSAGHAGHSAQVRTIVSGRCVSPWMWTSAAGRERLLC